MTHRRRLMRRTLLGVLIAVVLILAAVGWTRLWNPHAIRESNIDTSGWLLYTRRDGEKTEVRVFHMKDGSDRVWSPSSMAQSYPVWSSTGRLIAWIEDVEETVPMSDGRASVNGQLFIATPDLTSRQQLTIGQGAKTSPLFLPGDKAVLLLRQGHVVLARVGENDAQKILPPAHLVTQWNSASGGRGVLFSDPFLDMETRVVYAVQRVENTDQLVRYDPKQSDGSVPVGDAASLQAQIVGSRPTTLLAADRIHTTPGTDGTRLYVSVAGEGGALIAEMNLVTGAVTPLWEGKGPLMPGRIACVPNSATLAIEMGTLQDRSWTPKGIAVMAPGDAEPKLVVSGRADSPSWSPDGAQMAYVVYDTSGEREIWVCHADGSAPRRLINGRGDCYAPQWSPHP